MPTDLTSDFVSILEGDLRHPQIQYYENEKKNAIAPKITSKAKTAVQEEINSTVIETVANAVTTANSVFNALGLDAQDVAQRLTVHLEDASASMAQLSATLQSLQSLSDQAGNLIGCAGIVIDDVGNVLQSGQSTIGSASQLLPENAELTEVIDALDRVDQQLDRVQQSIDKALSDAAKWHEFLTGGLDQVDKQLAAQQEKLEELAANPILDKFPEVRSALQSAIDRIADLRQKIEERPDWENAVEELDGEVSRIRENLRMAVLRANDSVNSALNKMTANAREDLSKLSSVLGTGRQELLRPAEYAQRLSGRPRPDAEYPLRRREPDEYALDRSGAARGRREELFRERGVPPVLRRAREQSRRHGGLPLLPRRAQDREGL